MLRSGGRRARASEGLSLSTSKSDDLNHDGNEYKNNSPNQAQQNVQKDESGDLTPTTTPHDQVAKDIDLSESPSPSNSASVDTPQSSRPELRRSTRTTRPTLSRESFRWLTEDSKYGSPELDYRAASSTPPQQRRKLRSNRLSPTSSSAESRSLRSGRQSPTPPPMSFQERVSARKLSKEPSLTGLHPLNLKGTTSLHRNGREDSPLSISAAEMGHPSARRRRTRSSLVRRLASSADESSEEDWSPSPRRERRKPTLRKGRSTSPSLQHPNRLVKSSLSGSKRTVRGRIKDFKTKKEEEEVLVRKYTFLFQFGDSIYEYLRPEVKKIIGPHLKKIRDATNPPPAAIRLRGSKRGSSPELQESNWGRTSYSETPFFIEGGKMRQYQIEGLNWLISLYERDLSGILADEMGLGKTLQTIAFLGYLQHERGIKGPFLVVAPLSTLDNWRRECKRWLPKLEVCLLSGLPERREEVIQRYFKRKDFLCITSNEMLKRHDISIRRVHWNFVIVDEAQNMKNDQGQLYQTMQKIGCRHRLLLTGTPLQNNLKELWSLLSLIAPDLFIFNSTEEFEAHFQQEGVKPDCEAGAPQGSAVQSRGRVNHLQKLVRPFILRRLKSDQEKRLLPKKRIDIKVPLQPMQRLWYRKILSQHGDDITKRASRTIIGRFQNIAMQLRKCCCHPYLFEGAEPGPPYTTDEHIVENSGKLLVLDKLLQKVKVNGSRVLIFSQMARVLDILQDYCDWRCYEYCRLDGSSNQEARTEAVDRFQDRSNDVFVFLLSTRAGGLGINLTAADTVVFFDFDWNPQVDLQAEDRAHRIGQTKQVVIYRLVTENTIDEKILERAAKKMQLDRLIIQQQRRILAGDTTAKPVSRKEVMKESKLDLAEAIQHGIQEIMKKKANDEEPSSSSIDVERLIQEGEERARALEEKFRDSSLEELLTRKSTVQAETVVHLSDNSLDLSSEEEMNPSGRVKRKAASDRFMEHMAEMENVLTTPRRKRKPSDDEWQASDDEKRTDKEQDSLSIPVVPLRKRKSARTATRSSRICDFQFLDPVLKQALAKRLRYERRISDYVFPPLAKFARRERKAPDSPMMPGRTEEPGTLVLLAPVTLTSPIVPKLDLGTLPPSRNICQLLEEQKLIDSAAPLTPEEEEIIENTGRPFSKWTRRDFQSFCNALTRIDRDDYDAIAESIRTKSAEEVKEYSVVFWDRFHEVEGIERQMRIIREAQAQRDLSRQAHQKLKEMLKGKDPMTLHLPHLYRPRPPYIAPEDSDTPITYTQEVIDFGGQFNEEEDKFFLFAVQLHGLVGKGTRAIGQIIKDEILEAPLFLYNFLMLSCKEELIRKRAEWLVDSFIAEGARESEEIQERSKSHSRSLEGSHSPSTTSAKTRGTVRGSRELNNSESHARNDRMSQSMSTSDPRVSRLLPKPSIPHIPVTVGTHPKSILPGSTVMSTYSPVLTGIDHGVVGSYPASVQGSFPQQTHHSMLTRRVPVKGSLEELAMSGGSPVSINGAIPDMRDDHLQNPSQSSYLRPSDWADKRPLNPVALGGPDSRAHVQQSNENNNFEPCTIHPSNSSTSVSTIPAASAAASTSEAPVLRGMLPVTAARFSRDALRPSLGPFGSDGTGISVQTPDAISRSLHNINPSDPGGRSDSGNSPLVKTVPGFSRKIHFSGAHAHPPLGTFVSSTLPTSPRQEVSIIGADEPSHESRASSTSRYRQSQGYREPTRGAHPSHAEDGAPECVTYDDDDSDIEIVSYKPGDTH